MRSSSSAQVGEACFHLVELHYDLGMPFSGLLLAVVEVGHGWASEPERRDCRVIVSGWPNWLP
jgi:hypothetical protein